MSINRISLYHLETLLAIARLGTFAAAAEHMNTTQPAISARVSELESRLHTKIFQRNGRLMYLTPKGRQLVRDYLPIWDQLKASLLKSADPANVSGIVRIGAGEIAAAICLPAFVQELQVAWPRISLDVEIRLTAQMIEGLLSGDLDVAFAVGEVAHPSLSSERIGEIDLIWIANSSVGAMIEADRASADHAVWSLPHHSPIYQILRGKLAERTISHKSVNFCNNVRAMIDIVRSGAGFTLAPRRMVENDLNNGQLVEVLNDCRVNKIQFNTVYSKSKNDYIVDKVIDMARKIRI